MSENTGKLFLIPARLGDDIKLEVLPISIKKVIENTDHYIVENEKTARRFIKKVSPTKAQASLVMNTLNKFTDDMELPSFLTPCFDGHNVGILSEAGCPGIADPGADIVQIAHQKNITVVPLVGPSSILLAMMSSGMNGQGFSFNGYLPIDKQERKQKIKHLERISFEQNQSQLFIETPYRNDKLVEDLIHTLHPNTRLCIAVDITLTTEYIKTLRVTEWKNIKNSLDLHKRPCIFIIHKD
ncbi:SAM-dependent methyltransferase [Aquimarina agarilytica]|uniref:SAM-dependent methyltransferase n=1 Tax=Aquimarina agarilytica TaxID=1087449 RepID=UPI000287E061|nr:SAM-dependent methyltransferase [Aquimarina agarilytica]